MKDDTKMESDRLAWGKSVRGLLDKTVQLENQAKQFQVETEKLIKENRETAEEAAANTQRLFERHTKEMGRLRKLTEKQIEESHYTISSVEQLQRETKRQLARFQKPKAAIDHRLKQVQKQTEKFDGKRNTVLQACESHHERLDNRVSALEEQRIKTDRLLFDLRRAHTALEEDYHIKTVAMSYSHKCLLVSALADEDPRTKDFREKMMKRVVDIGESTAMLPRRMLNLVRQRLRSAASVGVDSGPNWDLLWQCFTKKPGEMQQRTTVTGYEIEEVTLEEFKVAMRREFKFPKDQVSDDQMITLFEEICGEYEELAKDDLIAWVEVEPAYRKVEEFDIPEKENIKERLLEKYIESVGQRPPKAVCVALTPHKIQTLKKRIRGAAWMSITNQGEGLSQYDQLKNLFMHYDKGGDGDLQDYEVKKAIRTGLKIPRSQLSDAQIWSLIWQLDADGDGTTSAAEFAEWVGVDEPFGDMYPQFSDGSPISGLSPMSPRSPNEGSVGSGPSIDKFMVGAPYDPLERPFTPELGYAM